MSTQIINDIICINFWSGRTEKYLLPAGTIDSFLNKSGLTLKFAQDCIHSDRLPVDWYTEFSREHLHDKIMPYQTVYNVQYSPKYRHLYIIQ